MSKSVLKKGLPIFLKLAIFVGVVWRDILYVFENSINMRHCVINIDKISLKLRSRISSYFLCILVKYYQISLYLSWLAFFLFIVTCWVEKITTKIQPFDWLARCMQFTWLRLLIGLDIPNVRCFHWLFEFIKKLPFLGLKFKSKS